VVESSPPISLPRPPAGEKNPDSMKPGANLVYRLVP